MAKLLSIIAFIAWGCRIDVLIIGFMIANNTKNIQFLFLFSPYYVYIYIFRGQFLKVSAVFHRSVKQTTCITYIKS